MLCPDHCVPRRNYENLDGRHYEGPLKWNSPVFFHRAVFCALILGGAGVGLSASPALAALTLSPLILDLAPNQPARGDIELFNNGTERLYVVLEPAEVLDAGTS